LPQEYRDRYFTPQGRVWQISENVKEMVTFKKLNLQEPFNILGTFELVLCRNVLIYFADSFKRDVLHRINQSLVSKGHLVLGASESIINYSDEFLMHRHRRGLYYQKKL